MARGGTVPMSCTCLGLVGHPLVFTFLTLVTLVSLFVFFLVISFVHNPDCVCQGSDFGDPYNYPRGPAAGGEASDPAGETGGESGEGNYFLRTDEGNYDSDPVVDRFRRYLRIRTDHPNPDYCCAVLYIQHVVNSIDYRLQTKEVTFSLSSSNSVYKPILTVTWRGSNSSLPSILLNSHMDVAEADPSTWSHDPFLAFMDGNGDIYARGAQDGKVSGMMYLEAIRNLMHRRFVPTRDVHVIFSPDEEIGGDVGFKAFVSSQSFRDLNVGVALDGGIVSSSDFFIPYNGEKAAWWLKIMASGDPTNGAFMTNNGSLENLLRSVNQILEYRQTLADELAVGAHAGDVTSISPTYLRAGTYTDPGYPRDMQPGTATAGFDIRVSPMNPVDPQAFLDLVKQEWAPASRNMSYEFSSSELAPVTVANESNPWWGLLADAVKRSGHDLSQPHISWAPSDMRHLRLLGIPCFNFVPVSRTIERIHSTDEYLNAGVYLAGIPVLEEIILAFASYTDSYQSRDLPCRSDE